MAVRTAFMNTSITGRSNGSASALARCNFNANANANANANEKTNEKANIIMRLTVDVFALYLL